jgi:cysteine-rich repeat protein
MTVGRAVILDPAFDNVGIGTIKNDHTTATILDRGIVNVARALSIGNTDSINGHISRVTSWDPEPDPDPDPDPGTQNDIPNGAATSMTFDVLGAKLGDTVAVGFSQGVPGGALLSGSVTQANKVTVTLANLTGNPLSLGEGTLRADVWQHQCGDGHTDFLEDCDDGGESATCDADCTPAQCGDGTLNVTAGEVCDDGYNSACGRCSANCLVAHTYPYDYGTCGDTDVCPENGEECDDGDTDNDDGCSSSCEVEGGWTCSGSPSACTEICGDRLVVGGEECDDGNTDSGDGCSSTCVCENTCGNDTVEPPCEECDDGNTTPGDGCDENCQNE